MGGEATPRPWRVVRCPKQVAKTDERDWPWLIKYEDDGEYFDLAIVQTDFAEANARLIVRAVNSHAALVEAIKDTLSLIDTYCDGSMNNLGFHRNDFAASRLRAALALAEKEGE